MKFRLLKSVFLALFFCFSAISWAQTYNKISENYYSCGIPSTEFNYIQSHSENGGKQERNNWCWAACVQMVLNYHNLNVSQRDVVKKVYGAHVDKPASLKEMLTALNAWAPDYNGKYFRVKAANAMDDRLGEMINFLANQRPLIIGLNYPDSETNLGHAYVLTEIYFYYKKDKHGNTYVLPDKVVLRDPAPENASKQEISWADFKNRVNMIVKAWVTKS